MLNVHDENLHITNDRAKDFPEPEVAVDDAWNEMKSQLDAEMPNSSVPSFSEKLIGGMGHSLNSLLIVLGIAGALTLALIYFINKSDKSVELSDPGFTVPDSDSAIIQEESITSSKDIETSVTELLINKQDNYLNTATFADILPGDDKKSASAFSGDSIAIKPSDSTKVDQVNNQKDRNLKLLVLPADQVNDKKVKTKINRLTIRNQFWEKINFGLQWGIPLPVQGTKYYFSGYDGKDKIFLSFIPGTWLSYRSNKNETMLQFHPFHQNLTGGREIISDELNNGNNQDSVSIMSKTTILNKTFGTEVGFRYNYHLSRTWIIGTGVGYHFQRRALLNDRVINRTNGVILSDSLYSIGNSSPLWSHLNSGYLTGRLEIARATKKSDIGVNLTLPLTDLLRESGQNLKPLNGQVFLRLKFR